MAKPLTVLQVLNIDRVTEVMVPNTTAARTPVDKDVDPAGAKESPLDMRRGGATVAPDTELAAVPNTGRGSGQAFLGPNPVYRG